MRSAQQTLARKQTAGSMIFRLTVSGLVACLLATGCSLADLNWGQSMRRHPTNNVTSPPPADPTAEQPVDAKTPGHPTHPSPQVETTNVNSKVAPLHQKIQKYAGRFPDDDLNRKANGHTQQTAAASPTAPQAAPAPPTTPQNKPAAPTETATLTIPPMPQQDAATQEQSPARLKPAISTNIPAQPNTQATPETTQQPLSPVDTAQPGQHATKPPIRANVQPEQITPAPIAPTPAEQASKPLSVEIIDIKPAPMSPVATPVDEKSTPATGQPTATQAPFATTRHADLADVITYLEQSMKDQPPGLNDQFKLRMLYLADGKAKEASDPMDSVDPVQAELLSAIFRAISAARDAVCQPDSSNKDALAAVSELRRLIGQQSGVAISKIALVTSARSFGVYEEISPLRFPAGKAMHAYLYAEVANLCAEPTETGELRTAISEKVEVFNPTGQCVWQRAEPSIEDRTRSPRRDFFIGFPVSLPADTPPGDYVLKVTIEDKIGATTDQQRLTFTVITK